MSTDLTAPPDPQTFLDFLSELEDGQLADDLTHDLAGLVAAMHAMARDEGGKPVGKLTISIAFKLDSTVFETRAKVSVVAPQRSRPRSILYRTQDNRLTANNPRQLELGVGTKDVSTAAVAEIRSIRRAE